MDAFSPQSSVSHQSVSHLWVIRGPRRRTSRTEPCPADRAAASAARTRPFTLVLMAGHQSSVSHPSSEGSSAGPVDSDQHRPSAERTQHLMVGQQSSVVRHTRQPSVTSHQLFITSHKSTHLQVPGAGLAAERKHPRRRRQRRPRGQRRGETSAPRDWGLEGC